MKGDQFTLERDLTALLRLFPQVQALADSEKDALSFWPEQALKDAITRERLIALVVDVQGNREVAGYLIHSGIFPHAKIQQIATLPKYRKQGVASALMRYFAAELERLGFMTIKAEVASDLGIPLAFYAKNRFEIVRTREGGKARKRKIIVHIRQLETDNLFTITDSCGETGIDLGIRRRSTGDAPFYAFDLNVYFDLARERANSDLARQLFGAALAHDIRLAVADEFVKELQRTTTNSNTDPILQLALRLPRIPSADETELDALSSQVHGLVFVQPQLKSAGSKQALSDARHLAHAALARASAFITGDGALLAARSKLISTIGIDLVTVDELVELLPQAGSMGLPTSIAGHGFEFGILSGEELKRYLADNKVAASVADEFLSDDDSRNKLHRQAIRENGRIVAIGVIRIPRDMEPVTRLLVHVRPEHTDIEMFADYLLDLLIRFACADAATVIELVHVPGQSATNSLAKARGFHRSGATGNYTKIALGRPVTATNWSNIAREIRRRTGLVLPNDNPALGFDRTYRITTRAGKTVDVTPPQIEDILSPTVFIWPERDAVLVPIARVYADELLGTSKQPSFKFITKRDAAFFSRRSYVNSPRTAVVMRPERPILFYESKRSGGRGAVVAVARIVDTVVLNKCDIPDERLRRLVVDDVDGFSASDDVLLTSFDNLFEIPNPVLLDELRRMGAIGRANLVSPVSLSSEQATQILSRGWRDG